MVVVFLLAVSGGLLTVLARTRRWQLRVVTGVLATTVTMVSGFAVVNDYYGYYRTWGTLASDLSGSAPNFGTIATVDRGTVGRLVGGTVRRETFAGSLSHISRSGFVYLPPQYSQPAYAHVRFPVVELLHGSPGEPADWLLTLRVTSIVDTLIARHLMGPVVLVMPAIDEGFRFEDCVNTPSALDDTYISQEVPADVRRMFRVSTDPAQWALGGYSSGGYCAANLALRHRGSFGAAVVMDGYFRATDGPAGDAIGRVDTAALTANSPLDTAAALPPATSPMPAFWVDAGSGNHFDLAAARAFVARLSRVERATFVVEPGGGHDFYSWSAALPSALAWAWLQIAPPDLRTRFPIVGPPTSVKIAVAERPRRIFGKHRPELPARAPRPVPQPTVTVTVTASPPSVPPRPQPSGSTSPRPATAPTPSQSAARSPVPAATA